MTNSPLAPHSLADHYRHFRVGERLLLTGHSHQAWPDCGLAAHDRTTPDASFGGFLVIASPHAGPLCAALRRHGVLSDHRGDRLRLGPAPYLSDDQLVLAMDALGECLSELGRTRK